MHAHEHHDGNTTADAPLTVGHRPSRTAVRPSAAGASSWVSGLFDVAREAAADVATELGGDSAPEASSSKGTGNRGLWIGIGTGAVLLTAVVVGVAAAVRHRRPFA
ncbi:hypothetical protein AB0N77_00275 [Streptomyces misionensis]|uniref:hypothetical protein n=1 Tax=Streptomyces misionensis TaxID=67331 RepID=UPI003437B44E